MRRDNFKCRLCGSEDKQLVVHHAYYLPGYEPWEYNDFCYRTICTDCHDDQHIIRIISESFESVLLDACGVRDEWEEPSFCTQLGHCRSTEP